MENPVSQLVRSRRATSFLNIPKTCLGQSDASFTWQEAEARGRSHFYFPREASLDSS